MVNVDRMPNDTQVAKWGNSLAVRIPRAIVKDAGLAEGDRLSLYLTADGTIVLRSGRRKYSLDELVARISKKNRHRETNWGAARG
jgi:antitoxin MazE